MEVIGANEWVYEPGDGRPWDRHSADANCVAVTFEDISNGRTDEIDWCFTAS